MPIEVLEDLPNVDLKEFLGSAEEEFTDEKLVSLSFPNSNITKLVIS